MKTPTPLLAIKPDLGNIRVEFQKDAYDLPYMSGASVDVEVPVLKK